MGKVKYDDGIERAIALIEAFRPKFDVEVYSPEHIDAVFKVVIEALKAEKFDAID